ncbi:hypothetical protein F3Y22_tig00111614pilonHSYRG00008 [Hibiscus syriacus]|uniref:Uncharacterized protein n=1 Tax=Hibiscus syriacus TaxID=106335 RepID=A0A6A2YD10_HIBSY|nr:hypothetical protein F3Y22_tig00111614pilonHSYRG00008 [Hibiscus syriacus]
MRNVEIKVSAMVTDTNELSFNFKHSSTVGIDLSNNLLQGSVPGNQGYRRFPGAFAGNPDLCVESSAEGCETARS